MLLFSKLFFANDCSLRTSSISFKTLSTDVKVSTQTARGLNQNVKLVTEVLCSFQVIERQERSCEGTSCMHVPKGEGLVCIQSIDNLILHTC